jgi:hypothetical protein
MLESCDSAMITLTVIDDETGQPSRRVCVRAGQLIAYEQQTGFTRLRMRGAKWLDVKEGTDEIDWMIRLAASTASISLHQNHDSGLRPNLGHSKAIHPPEGEQNGFCP